MLTPAAPNDPIFWLHQAFVDKVWADWQRIHPDRAHRIDGLLADGTPAKPSSLCLFTALVWTASLTRTACVIYTTVT